MVAVVVVVVVKGRKWVVRRRRRGRMVVGAKMLSARMTRETRKTMEVFDLRVEGGIGRRNLGRATRR